jgi:hypothetical protein
MIDARIKIRHLQCFLERRGFGMWVARRPAVRDPAGGIQDDP